MKIYIDSDCKCFTEPTQGRREFETDFFAGKCLLYIEGYRYIPAGETWVRSDGTVFHGESIFPWKPWSELDAAQRAYERELLVQYDQALSEIDVALGVNT